MSGWQEVALQEALERLIDYRGKSPKKSESGIPVISAKVVKSGRILDDIEQTIAPDYYPEWMRRGLPDVGDVVMTTEGPLGEVAQLDHETAKYALGQRIVTMRGRPDFLDNGFLKYLLMFSEVQERLHSRATGSTVAGISQASLRSMTIPIAPYTEQREIASILGALDDKIELNRRMAVTLEEIARALYRSWFVDFDPMKAKAEGLAPAFMDEATAALFPDRFGDDGLPEGWEIAPLSAMCDHAKKTVKPMEAPEDAFLHFSLPAFDAGKMPVAAPGATIKSNKTFVPDNAILFSRLNPTIPRVWWARTKGLDATPASSTEFFVAEAHDPSETTWLYCVLSSDEFREAACSRVTGTSNSHQRIPPKALAEIKVIAPSPDVVSAFGEIAGTWFEKIHTMATENQTLAALRDTLLPKLMSGELRVGEAQEQIEEVI